MWSGGLSRGRSMVEKEKPKRRMSFSITTNTVVCRGFLERRVVSQGKPILMSPGKRRAGWQKRWFEVELHNVEEDSPSSNTPHFTLCSYKRAPDDFDSTPGSPPPITSPSNSSEKAVNLRHFKVDPIPPRCCLVLTNCVFVKCCFRFGDLEWGCWNQGRKPV